MYCVLIGWSYNRYLHFQHSLEVLKSSDEKLIMVFLLSVLPSFCIRETNHCHSSPHFRENSIVKSIMSISQKSKFYRRASRFLCIMHNQFGMFYSLYWYYDSKILCVSVKLPYQGIYFTEKYARWWLRFLTVLLRL